jgi:hypothetical protein
VAERLKFRSGYSHPFPHGDKRNPVVYVHRIEDLAGSRWHVLGCIRDVGSDHSGRSNFLAHMLAIDPAEASRKPGGPGAVAAVKGCFRERWEGSPEPAAAAKVLVTLKGADDPPRPGDCPAWKAAGLDPGLAGDLAAAAMNDKAKARVVIVSRPDDDVLSLFVDALKLVEPSKRWNVTFNTCAIDGFEGTWKAIRADLGGAKESQEARGIVIDLTRSPAGSQNDYARFARGEAARLPWQHAPDARHVLPEKSDEQGDKTPKRNRDQQRKPPPKEEKEHKYTQHGRRSLPNEGERVRRYEVHNNRSRWRTFSALAASGALLAVALVAYPNRDRLFTLLRPEHVKPVQDAPETVLTVPERPKPEDGRNDPKYRQLQAVEDARARFNERVGHRSPEAIREDAYKLTRDIEALRRGTPNETGLVILDTNGPARDPLDALRTHLATCVSVGNLLAKPDEELKPEELDRAGETLQKADEAIESIRGQVHRLAEAERDERRKHNAMAEREQKAARERAAFVAFDRLREEVELPTPSNATDVDGIRSTKPSECDLGEYPLESLLEPDFRLAVPKETINGEPFKATIVRESQGSEAGKRWKIQYEPQESGLDTNKQPPRPLAYLVATNGRLILEVRGPNELRHPSFALFRRSVILAEAKDPENRGSAPTIKPIRLVKPKEVGAFEIDPFGGRQSWNIEPPSGIERTDRPFDQQQDAVYRLPLASVEIKADVAGVLNIDEQLPRDVKNKSQPGIWDDTVTLVPLEKELSLAIDVQLSLPQSTLAVEPKLIGRFSGRMSLATAKRNFIDNSDATLQKKLLSWENRKVKDSQFNDFTRFQALGWERFTKSFSEPLATVDVMGVHLPGHDTAQLSIDSFLKERHAEATRDKKETDGLPDSYDEWLTECRDVSQPKDWPDTFSKPLRAWWDWFRPKWEAQWIKTANAFKQLSERRPTIRILEFTSLAYDQEGNEYRVPIIKFVEGAPTIRAERAGAASSGTSSQPPIGIN